MYHIPTCKSAMQEHLKHSLESQASAEVDETCHSALKEGGLGMLSTDGMFMPLTSGSSSSMLAIGDNNDGGGDIDFQELATNVKRGDNYLKLGLQLLPTLGKYDEDCIFWGVEGGLRQKKECLWFLGSGPFA